MKKFILFFFLFLSGVTLIILSQNLKPPQSLTIEDSNPTSPVTDSININNKHWIDQTNSSSNQVNSTYNKNTNTITDESDLYNNQTKNEPFTVEVITKSYSKESLRKLTAGTILPIDESEIKVLEEKELGDKMIDNCFYYEDINDEIKDRITGSSYPKDCTIPYDELRYVRVLYYGFDDKTHIGELIVNKAIADDIIAIFLELYQAKYPIERMLLVDDYHADDNASMADNNTSSFNYRLVPGSTHLSKHALGLAIDINPLYNPYIMYDKDSTTILPVEGSEYANRSLDCAYYIKENDICFNAFTSRGFTWGGFWTSEPDYQHFQKNN